MDGLAQLRLLVVEDQGFQRWATEHMLRALGARHVQSAPDGHAALALVRNAHLPIDVIVTDLNMPGMDGIEFIRHLGEAGSRAALIVVSEQDPALLESVAAMARAYGAQLLQALRKPLDSEKLARVLATYSPAAVGGKVPAHGFTRGEIEAGLRYSEFEPHFQAKVEIATRAVRGAEALARWRHPRHGLLPAGSFLAILECHDKLASLTDMMISKSLQSCREWRSAGAMATLSVNLSLAALGELGLAERLEEATLGAALAPRDVVLEVTETAAATNLGRVLENLSRLRMKGFGLSLDDFGTGYASMQQLARIPFTELKIDQSFVRGALGSASSRAMLESSLEIASKLGIPAVGEGVETREQLELLASLGCAYAQGNFLAPPLPAPDFRRFLSGQAP